MQDFFTTIEQHSETAIYIGVFLIILAYALKPEK